MEENKNSQLKANDYECKKDRSLYGSIGLKLIISWSNRQRIINGQNFNNGVLNEEPTTNDSVNLIVFFINPFHIYYIRKSGRNTV